MPKEGKGLSFANLKVAKLGVQCYENAIREMKDPSGHLGFWLSGKCCPMQRRTPTFSGFTAAILP